MTQDSWISAVAKDAAQLLSEKLRLRRGKGNPAGGALRLQPPQIKRMIAEQLESRRMLTVLPNSTVLPSGLASLTSNGSNVTAEVTAIHDKLFAATKNLPLVGSALANAAGTATDSLKSLGTTITTNVLNTLGNSITGTAIQNKFAAVMGPSGLNILPNANLSVKLEDTTNGSSGIPNQVDINLEFTGTLFSSALHPSFNLGLPGIGLSVNGTIQANLTYDVKIDLVVNTSQGFYVDLSPNPEANLTLSVTAPGLSATGTLGFFQLSATDGTTAGNTKLVGTIGLDLSTGGTNQLTPSTLSSLVGNSTLSANAEADVHMATVLSFGGSSDFPTLSANLDITWNLANASLGADAAGKIGVTSSAFGQKPDIQFNNIQLGLGTFFTNFLDPIVAKIQNALAPVQPVINMLEQPAPIFNDFHLYDLDGNGTTTILEVLENFLSAASPQSVKFINAVVDINNLINAIPTNATNIMLPLGNFEVGGGSSQSNTTDVRGTPLSAASMTSETAMNTATELQNDGSSNSQIANFISALGAPDLQGGTNAGDGGGFHISLLQDPTKVFGLLLGQNVDLFTFDTPTLDLHPSISFSFAPIDFLPFVKVQFTGGADFKAHLSMGYDTYGIKEFASNGYATSDLTNLLDGFYIVDDPAQTYAQASLTLSVGLGLDIYIASAYVQGGITGTVNFDLHDPNNLIDGGKFRATAIAAAVVNNPLSLFDINGTISASFDLTGQYIGVPYDKNIATVQIASFAISATNPPVVPSFGSVSNGVLTLNIPNGDQIIQVNHVSNNGDGTETVSVTEGGITQDFGETNKIVGVCGTGNDNISVFANSPVSLTGTAGNEVFQVGPNEPATLVGGTGNDYLGSFDGPYEPSTAALSILGGGGNDTLVAGGGSDFLQAGGFGTATLYGGGGTDSLYAGAGDDVLYGGDNTGTQDELLIGGAGNDTYIADNSANPFDPLGLSGPQYIQRGQGKSVIQFDHTDIITSTGPLDTEVEEGLTILQNGVPVSNAARPSYITLPATTTVTYTGNSAASAVLAGAAAFDKFTNQQLLAGPIELVFISSQGAVGTPVEAGTYTVVGYYLGDSAHAVSPLVTVSLVINPATPTISALNTLVSFDSKPHAASVAASGPLGQNVSSQLQIAYKNLANSSVSTVAPTDVGTYEILASFAANRDYKAVTNLDTGKTVTVSTIFNAPTAVASDANLFGSLLADVNGDGVLDLVTEDLTAFPTVSTIFNVYLGIGNGTFQAPLSTNVPIVGSLIPELSNATLQHTAFVARIGTSTQYDLLCIAVPLSGGTTYGYEVLTFNSNGSLQNGVTPFPEAEAFDVLPADFNGDGKVDVVSNNYATTTAYQNTIQVTLNGGTVFTPTVGLAPRGVAVGDFNHDNKQDLIVSDSGGTAIMLGNGNGTFGAETYFSPSYTSQISVADLNKDGNPDIVVSDFSGMYAYLGNGNGTFKPAQVVLTLPPNSFASPIVLGDYNGDGIPDLATFTSTSFSSTTFQVRYGNGDGTFAPPLNFPINTTALLAGDLNGDGVTDLIQLDGSGDINILLNKKPSIAATISVNGATATFNNLAHGATVTATGLNSLNLSALLTVSYLDTVSGAVLTSPPTQGGTYDVLVSFAGNTAYNSVANYDTHQQIVINPAVPTLSFSSVNVPANGSPHAITALATGVVGENLTSLLLVQYQNEADGSISLTAPTLPGTYEVSASFQGNSNYKYVARFDTGRTVVITTTQPRAGGAILADGFTNSGGPYSSTAYANGATLGGNKPDTINLPGGTYTYFSPVSTYAGGVVSTLLGNSGSSFEIGPQAALAVPLSTSAGGYTEPSTLTLAVDLEMSSIAGTDKTFRGIALGLAATAPTAVAANGDAINNGILVSAATGNLSLVGSGGTSIAAIAGGTYNVSILGPFSASQFYHLSYTINTATGAITSLSLSDSLGTERIASAGTLPGYVAGTGSASSTANFATVSGSGSNGAEFAYIDNLSASTGTVAAVTPPTVTTNAPTSISSTGATLNGTINPQGSSTTAVIQYSDSPVFTPVVPSTLAAGFNGINSVAVDAAGNAYVADFNAGTVVIVRPDGTKVPFASGLSGPADVAVDSAGDIYVAEFFGNDVKKILPNGTTPTIGSGFSSPQGVLADNAGDVYVAGGGQVKEILPNGTIQNVGSGFNNPSGLALDSAGNLYVSDQGTNMVYKVQPNGTTTMIASGFNRPQNIALDAYGNIYLADFNNNAVKEIRPGGSIQPVGSGFSNPIGVAVDSAGDLLVADNGSHQLLKLAPVSVAAASALTGATGVPVAGTLTGLAAGARYYYRVVGQSAGGIAAGGIGSFYTLQAGQSGAGAVILQDGFSNSGPSLYANGTAVAGNKPDTTNLPGSTYSYYTTNFGYPGGTISTAVGNSGSSATVGPQSNIIASLQNSGVYAEPPVLTLSVDLEMNTIGGTDLLSRGIGLGLSPSVPNSFNGPNPINNGVIVSAATGTLYFTSSNGATITAVPGGTYSPTLLGAFSTSNFYTLKFTVSTATGVVTNLSLSDSLGTETIASPGALAGFTTGTGAPNSTANYVDVSSNANDARAFGYVDNLTVSIASAPTVTSGAATSITAAGATLNGTVNPQSSPTTTLFQYSTDPTFTPTVPTPIGSGFSQPKGVAVDAAGDVFVADTLHNAVKEILVNGTVQSVGAGFSNPYAVAVDSAGNVFVADFGNNAVKEVLRNGTIVTLGSGFSSPASVAVDVAGDLFVAESGHNAIKEILPNGTIPTIGSGFSNPQSAAVDSGGDVFVADYGNSSIKEVLPDGTILTLGSGFNGPAGVAVDSSGDIFVADTGNNALTEFLPGGTIKNLASGFFALPIGVAADAVGDVFVGDFGHNQVVKISPATITLASSPLSGSTATPISFALSGLSANTLYYYRAVALNPGGAIVGAPASFTTAAVVSDVINGTAAVDQITITQDVDHAHIDWTMGAASGQLTINDAAGLTINGNGSKDVITLDYTNGNPLPNKLNLNGTFTLNGLVVTGNPLAGTTLDINRSTLFVSYPGPTADPLALIQEYLKNGFNSGAWTGAATATTGAIRSSGAAVNPSNFSIGYADSADSGNPAGLSVNTIELRYAGVGDTNLNNTVDINDYNAVVRNFGSGTKWDQGNVTYDATVSITDYNAVVRHFGNVVTSPSPAPALAPAPSVPQQETFSSTSFTAADDSTKKPKKLASKSKITVNPVATLTAKKTSKTKREN